jgi:hypothetical protein
VLAGQLVDRTVVFRRLMWAVDRVTRMRETRNRLHRELEAKKSSPKDSNWKE